MVKRVRKQQTNPAEIEFTAPVAFKTQACMQADATSLPQTISYVVAKSDGVAWFQVACFGWENGAIASDHHVACLITYLPSNYFAR